jgi:hypothetical protein
MVFKLFMSVFITTSTTTPYGVVFVIYNAICSVFKLALGMFAVAVRQAYSYRYTQRRLQRLVDWLP